MKRLIRGVTAVILLFGLISTASAADLKYSPGDPALAVDVTPDILPPASPESPEAVYSGTVRVYLVEPLARWTDYEGYFYKYGFLDFPIVANVNLYDDDVWYQSAEYDASTTDIEMIFEPNIMAIGVIFAAASVATNVDGYWFAAHYADAAAAATPGTVGQNDATGGFTHTVFIEESTATT